jgi:phosphoglycolate phosphatase-like HAD superfamily hydrolase
MTDLFAYIIGRDVPSQKWRQMENKTQQFLRVSNMTGVPLERMVFIGDSNADYRSADQLGLHFIENRHNAIRLQLPRQSLIESLDPDGRLFITGKAGDLSNVLAEMERKVESMP